MEQSRRSCRALLPWCRLVSAIVLLPTNMTSDVVSSLMLDEIRYNCREESTEQGALKGKIAEVRSPPVVPVQIEKV